MANSEYTYSQVLNGTGFFNKKNDTGVSAGVKTMQGYLSNIGYDIDVDGRFGAGCETVVKAFQAECGLTSDGSAGPGTIKQLEKARKSKYFTDYGHHDGATWNKTNVLAKKFTDIDALARVIHGEYTKNDSTKQQEGIAIVIKNRKAAKYFGSNTTGTDWGKVICYGFTTVSANHAPSATPSRGDASRTDGIATGWKNAVDLATKLVDGTAITEPNGYAVTSTTVSKTVRRKVSGQKNFMGVSAYRDVADKIEGNAVSMYAGELKGTIFFDY